jgi:hypothetical protein
MTNEMVTIPKKEYEQLKEDSEWLGYLRSAGVDNWSGYEYAHELKREDEEAES